MIVLRKITSIFCLLFCLSETLNAQDFQWVKTVSTLQTETGTNICIDGSDNIYTVGFFNESADFDPGPDEYLLEEDATAAGLFIQKLDSDGNFLWAKSIENLFVSSFSDADIEVDSEGNVYVVGSYGESLVDFDPGPESETLSAIDGRDAFVLKLDTDGNFVWVKAFTSSGNVFNYSVVIDSSDNVLVGGYFSSTTDFDPGAPVFNIVPDGNIEFFVTKLNSDGDFLWAKASSGTNDTQLFDLATDTEGNVYATGRFDEIVDFDPGPDEYLLEAGPEAFSSTGSFIQKLDEDGNFIWALAFAEPATSNYATAGKIAIDSDQNVYSLGLFAGTIDFDPGDAEYELTSETYKDFYSIKLNEDGELVWVKQIETTGIINAFYDCVIHEDKVYNYLRFSGDITFDPDGGTTRSSILRDLGIQVLDSAGNFLWAEKLGEANDDDAGGLAINSDHEIILNGTYTGDVDFDLGDGVHIESAANVWGDFFVLKLAPIPPLCPSGTDTIVACDSYVWLDGETYTESTTSPEYTSLDCDSTVYLNLTINHSDSTWYALETCNEYTWIDGETYTASNDTAIYVLTNEAGCDSTVYLDLIINYSSDSVWDVLEACDEYTWIDGETYTTSNNTATYTLMNEAGCDSVVQLDLTIGNDSVWDILETCDEYTWIDGETYTTSNNTATYTLMNEAGCDSTVYLDLIINYSSDSVWDVVEACDEYTWIDGETYTTSNNTATYTLMNEAGCDSVVRLDLTINEIDITTTTIDLTIQANASPSTYQWLDCLDEYSVIPGETDQTFIPSEDGEYAVELTQDGCIDTSLCVSIIGLGISDRDILKEIALFPNPSNGIVNLDFGNSKEVSMYVYSMKGDLVYYRDGLNGGLHTFKLNAEAGIYFIKVLTDTDIQQFKLRLN